MRKIYLIVILFISVKIFAQFDGAAGTPGSLAIHKDSPLFVAWATGATVTRGLQDIANGNGNYASVGNVAGVVGIADGSSVVSLGDGGSAVVTFAKPIANGSGPDFAVFENAFNDTFLELGFVEVSSDGINFFRFPAVSNTQTVTQVGSFGAVDPTKIHNLAGKYRTLYGTPFDLDEVPDNPLLDKNAITHVKVIDVVGTINPVFARYDSLGQIVNDPYNTPFASSGFDLDAVGVIHQNSSLATDDVYKDSMKIYPNPAKDFVKISGSQEAQFKIFDMDGRFLKSGQTVNKTIDLNSVKNGVYVVEIKTKTESIRTKLIVSK